MQKKGKLISRTIAVFLIFPAAILLTACGAQKVQTVKIESEANQIIDILSENGIRANKTEIGEGERRAFEISVNGGDSEIRSAIQLMEDHCLPQRELPEIEGGMIPSMEVEREREQRRRKMDIESQLRRLPGATCVTVNFVMPQDRSLAINPYSSTASVTINYKTQTFPHTKQEIAGLVARSVPALAPENVEVVLAAKPLRPLPENKIGYNFARVALVSGIGLAMMLLFVSIIFFLRKKRQQTPLPAEGYEDEIADDEFRHEPELIGENYAGDERIN